MASETVDMSAGQAVNSSVSGNAIAGHSLCRMKLTWRDMEYLFAVNPEDYTQSEPNKATITQTKGGAWIDAWGEGIKELTIKGTTGVYGAYGRSDATNLDGDVGYRRWKALRNMVQHVYDSVQDGEKVELMKFYNYTDNEFFYVYPAQGGIELYRNKARPYLYQYTLHLWAVRRLGEGEVVRQALGNPTKYEKKTSDSSDVSLTEFMQLSEKVRNDAADVTQLIEYEQKIHDQLKG